MLQSLLREGTGRAEVRALMEAIRQGYEYKGLVAFDANFGPLVSTAPEVQTEVAAGIWARLGAEPRLRVVAEFVDDPQSGVCLDFVGVLRDDTGRVLGGVLARYEAWRHLLPGLQRWPVQSATAEVLLARLEDDRARVLTLPRHRPGTALRREVPLTPDSELVGVRGLFRPAGTVVHGVDLRGVPAMAVVHRVPKSQWVVVAKMDRAEALLRAREQLITVGLAVALVMGVAGLSVRQLWRHRQRGLIDRAREAETSRRELAERFGVFMRQANDAIVLFDAAQRIVESNPRALELYGYTQDEFLQLRAADLRSATERSNAAGDFAQAMKEGLIFQAVHQRKNGVTFPVEVSSRAVQLDRAPLVLSIIRDISERRNHEREIERLNRLYLLTSHILELIVHSRTREDLFRELCRLLVQLGEMRLAWVGMHDAGTSTLQPVARCGQDNAADYTLGLRISTELSVAEGRGPVGMAFRQGAHVLVQRHCQRSCDAPVAPSSRGLRAQGGPRFAAAL
jgi:PAS domain S-box-containing protein